MYACTWNVCRQQRVARELRLGCLSELTRRTASWHPSPAAQRWIVVAGDVAAGVGAITRYAMFALPAGRCLHSAEAIGSDPVRLWMSFLGRLPGSLYEPECSTGRNF